MPGYVQLIGVHGLNKGETDIPLGHLLIEHALSINTAAAGSNASLMIICRAVPFAIGGCVPVRSMSHAMHPSQLQ
jgi:hypothetical protein